MKGIRNFDEFIKENIVKKQGVDRSRAEFLIKESAKGYDLVLELVEKLKVDDINANMFVKSFMTC